ncbi:MAG: nitroreductase family protein [Firmicutes bacterium]|nr:nitroreductase family protein [Bacillota bacterium]
MEYQELIMKRQTYRETFADDPVPEEDLKKILNAGIMAPSGYNLQSTTFVAVTDEALIKQIAEIMPTNATQSAKAMIVPVTKYIESNGMSFEFEDYGAAVENMLLAIADLGYASVWMDGQVKMGDHREQLAKLLNVPDDMTVRAVLPIGKPSKEIPMRGRKPFEERVVFNRF